MCTWEVLSNLIFTHSLFKDLISYISLKIGFTNQGRRENSRGPGQNYVGPYDVIIFKQRLKTGGQCSEALSMPLNGAVNALQLPRF